MISAEKLRDTLTYNPETGVFLWKQTRPGVKNSGVAGRFNRRRGIVYREIAINGVVYKAHRLAWLYVYGVWPQDKIDHIDGNGLNNAISNLREASACTNGFNVPGHKHSLSKLKGAHWCARDSLWRSSIRVNGKRVYLGTFPTPEEAHAAYCDAAKTLHGEFCNTSSRA